MAHRKLIAAVVASYLVMLFGGASLKPGYSHLGQFISELNATGTPHAALIGWLGFVPFGLLVLALLVSLAPHAPVRGASRIGYWMLSVESAAYIGSALAPCDLGCPLDGSISQVAHNLLGLATYLLTTLALALLSLAPGLKPGWRAYWLLLAVYWLVLFGLMLDPRLAQWSGLLQRLAEWLVYGSLLVAAWRIPVVARRSPPPLPSRPA